VALHNERSSKSLFSVGDDIAEAYRLPTVVSHSALPLPNGERDRLHRTGSRRSPAGEDFYGNALGWTFNDYGPDYAGIQDPRNPGGEFGGLSAYTPASRGEGVLALVRSEDADDTLASVLDAGGRVQVAMHEYPGGRRFTFADPSGNVIGVYEPTE
jgi:hypothetical protein